MVLGPGGSNSQGAPRTPAPQGSLAQPYPGLSVSRGGCRNRLRAGPQIFSEQYLTCPQVPLSWSGHPRNGPAVSLPSLPRHPCALPLILAYLHLSSCQLGARCRAGHRPALSPGPGLLGSEDPAAQQVSPRAFPQPPRKSFMEYFCTRCLQMLLGSYK